MSLVGRFPNLGKKCYKSIENQRIEAVVDCFITGCGRLIEKLDESVWIS